MSVKLDFKCGTAIGAVGGGGGAAAAAVVVDALGAARIDEPDVALDLTSGLYPLENQSIEIIKLFNCNNTITA